VIGGALAYTVSPTFALASAAAFLFSEAIDLAVYTPVERRSWLGAVVLSNTASTVVDSMLYLALVFGSQEFLAGQVVGKMTMTALAVPVLALIRPRLQLAYTAVVTTVAQASMRLSAATRASGATRWTSPGTSPSLTRLTKS
jgi:uncharacterized PurR-regulated membrane protein YhhQ (DUF165 family)